MEQIIVQKSELLVLSWTKKKLNFVDLSHTHHLDDYIPGCSEIFKSAEYSWEDAEKLGKHDSKKTLQIKNGPLYFLSWMEYG